MKINAIKTEKILPGKIGLIDFLNKYIKELKNNSVIVISSKIIAIMENRIIPLTSDIDSLIKKEADFFISKKNRYGRHITIKYNALISASGIDQSNGNGFYVLLPSHPQMTANKIYDYLTNKFKTENFGIIIADSRSMPLRSGATGVAIGFWGFSPLKSYIGIKDIFGRKLQYEKANIVDPLAGAAVLAMGEGEEQTPLAIIEDLDFIRFNNSKPTAKELKEFYLSLDKDIFHQFYERFLR